MKESKFSITLPISEGSSVPLGEEATTEALGEEHPTTTSEGPAEFRDVNKRGGPFGAF